jgi:hypothetical protein
MDRVKNVLWHVRYLLNYYCYLNTYEHVTECIELLKNMLK